MDENRGLTMHEILFRGKRTDNGKWIEGFYSAEEYNLNIKKIEHIPRIQVIGECVSLGVIPETVGQYTGLTDRNGKKIFEGDIVKLTDDCNNFEWKAVVVFGNPGGAYCWGWNFLPIDGYKGTTDILMWVEMEATGAYCEVIGNIYDNPELMKGGNNNG